MNQQDEPNAKVLFRVRHEDGSDEVETLWAVDLGGDQYKLANCPFFAYSVSWDDIVFAPFSSEEQFPTFVRVVEKSGNRTIRLLLDSPIEEGETSNETLRGLVVRGCSYENADGRWIVINIPPGIELGTIRDYLIECGATWEHADPSYAELFPEDP